MGAAQTALACRAEGAETIELQVDVPQDTDCRAIIDAVIARFGRLDALVNNVGATEVVPLADLEVLSAEHFQRLPAINVVGAFQMTRAAAPYLAQGPCAVVNISSLSGINGSASSIAYAASKGALNTEWMLRSVGEQAFQRTKDHVAKVAALGGVSSADDIADAVIWLLHSRAMTGELIRIDAGFTGALTEDRNLSGFCTTAHFPFPLYATNAGSRF